MERRCVICTVCIYNCRRFRQCFQRLVVVSNHQRHAQIRDQFRFRNGCDTVVHRHDQFHAILVHGVDSVHIQTVSLVPFRNAIGHIGTHFQQVRVQDHRGSHTVTVIVAVDADAAAVVQSRVDACRGSLHVRCQKRVCQSVTL